MYGAAGSGRTWRPHAAAADSDDVDCHHAGPVPAIGIGEGGELQAPLARVVIGGLLTSTMVTLVLVPAIIRCSKRPGGSLQEGRASALRIKAGLKTRLFDSQDPPLRREESQQLLHRSPGHGIAPVRRDLGQRLQHEPALAKSRMRHDERRRLVDDRVAIENQIQIQRPWRTRKRPLSPEISFDGEQRVEECPRAQRRLPHRRRVQKNRLRTGDADWRRVVKVETRR